MNKGFFHPIHNPEGTSKDINGDTFETTSLVFLTTEHCLDPTKYDAAGVHGSGRFDGKTMDDITGNVVLTKRSSAELVQHAVQKTINTDLELFSGGYQHTSYTSNIGGNTTFQSRPFERLVGPGEHSIFTYNTNIPGAQRLQKDSSGRVNLPDSSDIVGVVRSIIGGGEPIINEAWPINNGGGPGGDGEVATLTASDAEEADNFGSSVAVDGTRLVVGAIGEDTAGINAGKVYVYEWNGASYVEVATVTASGAANDEFGSSVAIDGTRLVVGAAREDTGALNAGKIYVYDWNGTSYVEVGTLTASDAQEGDLFGWSVALDGTRLVVGAYGEDTAADRAGKVYIYDWNGTSYVEVSTLTASDAGQGDRFGSGVALDGTRLVVSAPDKDTSGTDIGKVYIYDWNGTSYVEVGTLTASDAETYDLFGTSVSLDGSRLVVGSAGKNNPGFDAGKVYIYEWNGTSYDEVGTLMSYDAQAEDYFGQSVALYGTRLVVGAHREDTAASEAGKVYIYDLDELTYGEVGSGGGEAPEPAYSEVATLTSSDAAQFDNFGSAVAVDGTRLVVGAHQEDTAGAGAGKVYVYDWNGSSYVEVATVTASDAQDHDYFGSAVALSGTRLVVGAREEDTAGTTAGKVYIYDWNGTSYDEVGTLTASDADGLDLFGSSVSLDGTRLAVGARHQGPTYIGAGKVYIYDWNGTTYTEVATLTASDAAEYASFGASVALGGTRLVVGARNADTAVTYSGKVYIYEWNGTSYDEVGTLTASDAQNSDFYGASVALDSTRLVVGAMGEATAGLNAGKVYFYEWNGTSYDEVGTLTASDAQTDDYFGTSVAVDGTRLAVGAYREDTAGTDAGTVYIYNWNDADNNDNNGNNEVATLTASDAEDYDQFGYSVAVDGTRLVVGAIWEDTSGSNAGKVYVYEWNGTTYDEVATLTASDGAVDDYFGCSVALDGTRLAVGAYGEDTAGLDAGKVYIYDWNGTTSTYDEVGTLTASDAAASDWFGRSVALDGTRLVVGAPYEDTAAAEGGKVYIYEWNGTTYDEVATVTASDADVYDQFGWAVSLDSTRLVVGAPREDTAADVAGKVYIYDWNGTTYTEVDTLTASDVQPDDRFGSSVAVSGTRLAVSSRLEDTAGTDAGKVYVYEWNGTNYDEVGTLTASDAEAQDYFGTSVAVDGTRLVVGSPYEDTAGTNAGKVYVYDWNDTINNGNNEGGPLTASDAEPADLFGASVAVEGTRLVVGADREGTAAGNAGKVYIYDWNGTTYDEVGTLTASDAQSSDRFGSSVALDGTRLVVGAPQEDTAASNAGKVYIYDWNGTTSTYDEVATIIASDAASNDIFGTGVALDGTRLVVGAPNEDTAGSSAGKVYIYDWNGTSYTEVGTLTASDAEADDYFGQSVALDGARLVVGATADDTAASNAGKVYIYDWNGTTYVEVGTLTASDAQPADLFGQSVALDGTRLVVGAYGEDTAATDAGKVYVYEWNGTSYVEVATITASDAEELDVFGWAVALDGTRLVVGAPLESTAGANAGKVYYYDYYFDFDFDTKFAYEQIDPESEFDDDKIYVLFINKKETKILLDSDYQDIDVAKIKSISPYVGCGIKNLNDLTGMYDTNTYINEFKVIKGAKL